VLFRDIPLENVSISLTANATAAPLLAMIVALAKQRGVPTDKINGTTQNDILKEIHRARQLTSSRPRLAASGCGHYGILQPASAQLEHHLHQRLPHPRGGLNRRAGGWPSPSPTPSPTSRRRWMRGLPVDSFAPRLSFFFNAHNDFSRGDRQVSALRGA
jgi:methylmalonyl-CoA mutase N-terminal domain/subunit